MKVLVTGAAGFVGSHLVDKLLARGDEVVGLDNFNDYYDPARKRDNLSHLAEHVSFELVEGDVRDKLLLKQLFEQHAFDAIAHLAAMAGVRQAVKQPTLYVEVDYNGTQNLMECARQQGTGNFVFASTSSVYGNSAEIPFVETAACDKPLQPYAAAKRGAEILGYTYHHLYGLNFTAIRFFTVYGPRNRPDMMIHLVADSITHGTRVPLYENGQLYRDWTFVGDIVDGIVAAIDKPLGYEIINLGRGKPVLLRDFIDLIEEMAGGTGNFELVAQPAADMKQTWANTDKAARLLAYQPSTDVADGVAAFWRWYAANLSK